MTRPLVELRDVHVTYRRRGHAFRALEGITLDIAPGEHVGLVGGSGSGKTTIIRTMLGLTRLTSGEVWFDGNRVDGVPERRRTELRSRAALVFQDPFSSLNPRMRVSDIVAEPLRSPRLRSRGLPPPDDDVVAEMLDSVGLGREVMSRFPHQLSGGQRQRVAIARALVGRPDLLIADEPVSALDVSVRAQVLNLLNDLAEERSLAFVLVSHDLAVVRHMCQRVVVVERGVLVESGPVERVYGAPQHPYTRALLDATLSV